MKEILNKVKSSCKTKRQMKAFNQLAESFKERKTFAEFRFNGLREAIKQDLFFELDPNSDFYNKDIEKLIDKMFGGVDKTIYIDSSDLDLLPKFDSTKDTGLQDADGNSVYTAKAGKTDFIVFNGGDPVYLIKKGSDASGLKLEFDWDDNYFKQFE